MYRRALTDLRDGVRRPQTALSLAVRIDPEFAAAHLRLSMAMLPPVSTSEYGEAARFRASLDPRDLEIMKAEEPIATAAPPDLAEAERRYAALHKARPRDVEIFMRPRAPKTPRTNRPSLRTYLCGISPCAVAARSPT
jgi:hypothetical protein